MKKIYILNCFDKQDNEIIKVNPVHLLNGGIHLLKTYQKDHPNTLVFMDTKINDFDYHLADAENITLADIISVNGSASDEVIRYVLRSAKAHKKEVLVDLSGLDNLNERLLDMDIFGVDYINIDNEDFIKL